MKFWIYRPVCTVRLLHCRLFALTCLESVLVWKTLFCFLFVPIDLASVVPASWNHKCESLCMFAHRLFRHLTSSTLCRSFTTLMATSPKQIKMLKIGTHDGVFHCDESLACYLIKLLPEYKDAEIIRSRNQADLDQCDIVVDVGRVYDVSGIVVVFCHLSIW